MYKTKLAIIIDSIFISIIFFIISFIWINKYIKNAILSFIVSNIIAILWFIVIFKFSLKRHNLKNLKNKDLKLAEKCLNKLKFYDDNSTIKFFEKLLNSTNVSSNIYTNKNLYFYVQVKKPLCEDDFFIANNYFISTKNQLPLCFIGCNVSNEFSTLIENSPITYEVYNSSDLYLLMKESNTFPDEIQEEQQITKKTYLKKFKNKFLSSITKNHFKDFFISGLSLIVLSIFIPYSLYYSIFGSILLILSIVSLFNKNKAPLLKTKTTLSDAIKKNDA